MRSFLKIFALALTLALSLSIGCSDRGTNSGYIQEVEEGGMLVSPHIYFDELFLQIRNPFQVLGTKGYLPRVAYAPIYGGRGKPVPLLILLPPQGYDEHFYFDHGLMELADELIAKGEIQPMAILTISNDLVFGGYFYAGCSPGGDSSYTYFPNLPDTMTIAGTLHNPGSGDYDLLLGYSLPDYIRRALTFVIDDPSKWGIGGLGMGAYGAFRTVMLHPGVFTSVSAVDSPLDFDGADGNAGFETLFDDVIAEQALGGDLSAFDSSSALPLTQLFIGGSLAFSPHDTMVTLLAQRYMDRPATINSMTRYVITDSTTLVEDVIKADENNFDFHLPFDVSGNAYAPIWEDLWLPNNLENILPNSTLDGVDIWIATSAEAHFGYHEQTTSFISTLTGAGYAVNTLEYSGYDGSPATFDRYVYDLMREMLIFHSESFGE
ncbi:MAG: hypothetical protein JSW34_04835 [Candidatus Zixiibacteriota bacterium]|nr:MAG: hypothetical protein JSW34_04835 [candidate division Zixibacteria bacterium]